MALLLFLALVSLTAGALCPSVTCTDSLPLGQCYRQDSDGNINFQLCPENQTCEFNHMLTEDAYSFEPAKQYCKASGLITERKFPGESCTSHAECYSGFCSAVCVGGAAGTQCRDSAECAVGLVCKNSTCREQQAIGGPCMSTTDCVNSAICYRGACSAYFSQAEGASGVTEQFVCQSGYAKNGFCTHAPANKQSPDFPCSDNSECELTNNEEGVCACGLNTEGLAFCMGRPGDSEFLRLKELMQAILPDSLRCHFNTSLTQRCPQQAANANFSDYTTALYIYYYRPLIVGIPSCVFSVMPFATQFPYAHVELAVASRNSSTVVIIVAVCVFSSLLLFAVICFLCVRKYARRESQEQRIRRRINNNELGAVEVFVGIVPDPPPPASPDHSPKFRAEDIALCEEDRRFLKVGIPLAQEVHEETHVPIGEQEFAPVAETKSRQLSDSDTHPNSDLIPLHIPCVYLSTVSVTQQHMKSYGIERN